MQWSEVYDHFKNTLPKEVIVHVWKDVTNVTEVLAGGYDVLRNVSRRRPPPAPCPIPLRPAYVPAPWPD